MVVGFFNPHSFQGKISSDYIDCRTAVNSPTLGANIVNIRPVPEINCDGLEKGASSPKEAP